MTVARLSGNFCGMPLRIWGVLSVFFIMSISIYSLYDNLNNKILTLSASRSKLEKAITKLQLDSLDISRRHLSFAEDTRSGEKELDDAEDTVIIYNRVPKTGSTSLAGVMYELCTVNKYHVIHLNVTKNQRTISLADQMRFITNITSWEEKKPAVYHGHLAFIDFGRFGVRKLPIYINLVREPLERLISYYYFVRYGDDFKPFHKRRKAGDNETFDDCVARDGEDCDPDHLWVQIPYFCGHHAECWEPGSQWALEQAKRNLLQHYLVVGVTEEMRSFIAVLEATLPRFFAGASAYYEEGSKSHLRKTAKKFPPKPETAAKIQTSRIWRMENDFYVFVLNHFHYIRQHTLGRDSDGDLYIKDKRFMFEKIRPR